MAARAERIVFETDSSGSSSVLSARPVCGRVVEVRVPDAGAVWTAGGSADVTVTRREDGGTVLAVTNVSAPFSYRPVPVVHTTSGAVAGTATVAGVLVDDHVRVTVAQAAPSTAGTVFVLVEVGS